MPGLHRRARSEYSRGEKAVMTNQPLEAACVNPIGMGPMTRTEQIRSKAFDSRENAVAYAQAVIDARREHVRAQPLVPRYRALRESFGLPADI